MMNDPDIRKGLLVSIVTSVLVLIFIDPLLKMATNLIMSLGSGLAVSWTNGIYLSAALGLREKFSFIILALGSSLTTGIALGFATGRILNRRTSNESFHKFKGKLFILDMVFAIIFLIGCFAILASNFAELQLVASFNQRVTVLAAKASDQQIKELRASWASMENRKDYESINNEIKKLSSAYAVKLPAPLWE
jgi:hypothetical protein